MKKFNIIVICLVFSCFMFMNILSAQNFALNLSNVENPVAKSSFLQSVNYTGTTSYYNLFNPNKNVGVSLSLAPSTSIMLAQANPALNNSKFDFMSVLTSTGSDNAFRFSVGGRLTSSVGSALGFSGGIGGGCDTYSTVNNTPGLNAYFSNGASSGTPILNTYYNGSTGNSNLGGQGRTVIRGSSSNSMGLRRSVNKQ